MTLQELLAKIEANEPNIKTAYDEVAEELKASGDMSGMIQLIDAMKDYEAGKAPKVDWAAKAEENVDPAVYSTLAAAMTDFPDNAEIEVRVKKDASHSLKVHGVRGSGNKTPKQNKVPIAERKITEAGENVYVGTVPLYKGDVNVQGENVGTVVLRAKEENYMPDDPKLIALMYGGKEGKYNTQYGPSYRRLQELGYAPAIQDDPTDGVIQRAA